jgi:hypothetical protein
MLLVYFYAKMNSVELNISRVRMASACSSTLDPDWNPVFVVSPEILISLVTLALVIIILSVT